MDAPDLHPTAHRHALSSLARANRLLRVNQKVSRCLNRVWPRTERVLDLGCGDGSLLRSLGIAARASQALCVGVDRSCFALRCGCSQAGSNTRFVAADVRSLPFRDEAFDIVLCALLVHHFDGPEAVKLLSEARRVARRAVMVSDLVRSWPAFLATWLATRMMSRSWVFHVDGPRSVRAAYRPAQLAELARQAGMDGPVIRRQFPFRMLMVWCKVHDARREANPN